MKSPWTDQKSPWASASSMVSAGWESSDSPWISPECVLGIRSLFRTILLFHLPMGKRIRHLSGWSTLHLLWCVHHLQVFQVCYQIISLPISSRDQFSAKPNWWIPAWTFGEDGWYSTIAPKGIIGPLNGSPNRLSCDVFPSVKKSWTCRR